MKRAIRIEGDLAYVPLTQGYVAVIDAADVPLVDGFNWCAQVTPRTVYAIRGDYSSGRRVNVRMHRQLMGASDRHEVDHKDGNGLNNRRHGKTANLRMATRAQNSRNQRIRIDDTSGLKGVTRHRGKWQATIALDGKNRYLGIFPTKREAAEAYAKASAEMHGEFGRTE